MSTRASDEIRWAADQLVHHCGYPSAVLAGIVPDARHLARGGFHVSVLDLRAHGNAGDYSNTRPNDKDFNVEFAAAIDLSLAKTDMIRAHGRIRTVWADKTDPRRRYVNAINCWDGSGDATRYDFDAGTAKFASADHKTHTHSEIHRRWVRDMKAMRALVSIYSGESKAAWTSREEKPAVTEGASVSLSEADKTWITNTVITQTQKAIDTRLAAIAKGVTVDYRFDWSADVPADPASYRRDLADFTGDVWAATMKGTTRGGDPLPPAGMFGQLMARLDRLEKLIAATIAPPRQL